MFARRVNKIKINVPAISLLTGQGRAKASLLNFSSTLIVASTLYIFLVVISRHSGDLLQYFDTKFMRKMNWPTSLYDWKFATLFSTSFPPSVALELS